MSAIAEAVRADVVNERPDWCATKWVLEPMPFLFAQADNGELWRWKASLATGLDVDAKNLLISGSAAVGVSLNPYKNFKPFGDHSDIDVAVISAYHFDVAWRALRNLGTRRFRLTPVQMTSLKAHVERHIYWGTVATDQILPILPFAAHWLTAVSQAAMVEPTEGREINVRIYRDFASLRSYLHLTFRKLRDHVLGPDEAESMPIKEDQSDVS
jgi:hypothetical protein